MSDEPSERLKDIKFYANKMREDYGYPIITGDINWLIERIETLEKRNERLMIALNGILINHEYHELPCALCNVSKALEGTEG